MRRPACLFIRGWKRASLLSVALGGLFSCTNPAPALPPTLTAITPINVVGGSELELTASGDRFAAGDMITLDGQPLATSFLSPAELRAHLPAQRRGRPLVAVQRGELHSAGLPLEVRNTPPRLRHPGPQTVAEETSLQLPLLADDFDGDKVRLFVTALPPGATFSPATGMMEFTPDFIQGGEHFTLNVTLDDGFARVSEQIPITVNDTIRPPDPVISKVETFATFKRLTVTQTTDAYLDSPGYAGRNFIAYIMVPLALSPTHPLPARISLHGFDGLPWQQGWEGELRIAPYDPANTYWWGYSETLPGGAGSGVVPEYTLRRVLHLLSFALRTMPGIDRERIYVEGASMGGAGAATLGLLHARHFCAVQATIAQAIPRNHRPSRVAQLAPLWGSPPAKGSVSDVKKGVWDRADLTRVLHDVPEAQNQFIFFKHGKDDATIHFGAVVGKSPLTDRSLYQALAQEHVGHFVVWDEGGHGISDPLLNDQWWERGWNPVFDDTSSLVLHRAFPAFSASSLDNNPGDGSGNGKQPWNAESGFAGKVEVAGDTGWSGDIAGAHNRFLRWDGNRTVDTIDRLQLPLRVLDGQGGAPPRAGYPTTGDKLPVPPPVRVDVTPRRVQQFLCLPGEQIHWQFGAQQGVVSAAADGSVTVGGLLLTSEFQTLVLTRK
ncbi:MAG: hypothetical protein QM813_18905 [Verrucomicrobiota bacterium]